MIVASDNAHLPMKARRCRGGREGERKQDDDDNIGVVVVVLYAVTRRNGSVTRRNGPRRPAALLGHPAGRPDIRLSVPTHRRVRIR